LRAVGSRAWAWFLRDFIIFTIEFVKVATDRRITVLVSLRAHFLHTAASERGLLRLEEATPSVVASGPDRILSRQAWLDAVSLAQAIAPVDDTAV